MTALRAGLCDGKLLVPVLIIVFRELLRRAG